MNRIPSSLLLVLVLGCGGTTAPAESPKTPADPAAPSAQDATTPEASATADATPQSSRQRMMRDGAGPRHDDATCPMQVAGTSAVAKDTEAGAALVFTTGGDVAELRRRVAQMAERHNQRHGRAGDPGMQRQNAHHPGMAPSGGGGMQGGKPMMHGGPGTMGGGMQGGKPMMHGGAGMAGGMRMPPSVAKMDEIEGGARLTFTPVDAADLPQVRAHVQQRAQKMAQGTCPMMNKPQEDLDTGEAP